MAFSDDWQLQKRREVAEEACRAAARVHLEYRQPALPFETKNNDRRDLVTVADTQAQIAAIDVIQRAFPGEPIIGEEGAPSREEIGKILRDHGWLIDPLDGTFNYVHGFPDFSATVAFVVEGKPVVGATYAPVFDEMFSAAKGHGTTLNGKQTQVSPRKGLKNSIVNVWLGRQGDPSLVALNSRVQQHVYQQRQFGGTAIVMAYVAAGRFDLFYVGDNPRMGDWDIAAGAILVEEAGGVACQTNGDPLILPSINVAAAADPGTLEELRALLAE